MATYASQSVPNVDKILNKLANYNVSTHNKIAAGKNHEDLKPSPMHADCKNIEQTESLQLSLLTHADDLNISVFNAHKLNQTQELKKHIAILYLLFESFEKKCHFAKCG